MLKAVKELFIPTRDYAGRNVDLVIARLSSRTQSNVTDWSYLHDEHLYVNTINGMKVFPHEIIRYAA